MNAPTLTDLRSAAARDLADEKMEQVRELLIGDAVRQLEARISYLEGRLTETEIAIGRKLDTIEGKIAALTSASDGDRRTAFEALARSIGDLGEQVRRISRG